MASKNTIVTIESPICEGTLIMPIACGLSSLQRSKRLNTQPRERLVPLVLLYIFCTGTLVLCKNKDFRHGIIHALSSPPNLRF